MAGKMKQRNSANAAELATVSVNEKILKECHKLYTEPNNGLVKIAEHVDLKLLAPRKKIIILLMGNHSAGKSTFINWYIEEHVQKTGVAIETQGFTFVTSGKKRESLTGNATLHLYPHFKPLKKIKGVVDYLSTEISTSRQKKFGLVTFIDTPGLVDGDMNYPFDVNQAILWLGDVADLIFVFFDPIGQALCKRTLDLVEKLNDKHSERVRFYLSKADESGHESDRQRVMMQIVQELCKRPGLNKTCFDMPTIYIPHLNKPSRCVNQIEEVCKDIEKSINQTMQTTLNVLEKDCRKISHLVDLKIHEDNLAKSHNRKAAVMGVVYALLGVAVPFLLFINFLVSTMSRDDVSAAFGKSSSELLFLYLAPVRGIWAVIPAGHHLTALGIMMLLSLILLLLARKSMRMKSTLSRKQKKDLCENQNYVQKVIREKKEALYREYLHQSVGDHDV